MSNLFKIVEKKYKCDNCKKYFDWDEKSCWHGSYQQLEESPNKIKVFCSKKCGRLYFNCKQTLITKTISNQ